MSIKQGFDKELLQELADLSKGEICLGHTVMSNELSGDSRWHKHYTMIFQAPDGAFWEASYRRAATEMQDGYPFEGSGDQVQCTKMTPVEKTVIDYVEATS